MSGGKRPPGASFGTAERRGHRCTAARPRQSTAVPVEVAHMTSRLAYTTRRHSGEKARVSGEADFCAPVHKSRGRGPSVTFQCPVARSTQWVRRSFLNRLPAKTAKARPASRRSKLNRSICLRPRSCDLRSSRAHAFPAKNSRQGKGFQEGDRRGTKTEAHQRDRRRQHAGLGAEDAIDMCPFELGPVDAYCERSRERDRMDGLRLVEGDGNPRPSSSAAWS